MKRKGLFTIALALIAGTVSIDADGLLRQLGP